MICAEPTLKGFLKESFTEKEGEKFGEETPVSSSKISAKRCGKLISIALANELNEIWISFLPTLLIVYLYRFYPSLPRLNELTVGRDWDGGQKK
ncbi:dehydrogenase/reductase SDR family member 7-like [Belonocnema kinseyi]|uniref:dehydrogenase/reductase SDR family member 7-like n=1 Tax=Belonocnema kinseyi TaxID=2817044 RepID=UPI00143D9164|nr:dehydrogenase/reductase SDR family member 7-like [Belonocnema kinseyi]